MQAVAISITTIHSKIIDPPGSKHHHRKIPALSDIQHRYIVLFLVRRIHLYSTSFPFVFNAQNFFIPLTNLFQPKRFSYRWCDFRFKINVLPTATFELSPSHLLLYKTTLLVLDCARGQQILEECFFCVVKIPCRCSVTANNLYLPPRLGKCNNNTDDITILHPVNLALLQQFFHKDSHSTIFVDSIFEEFVHIQLPNFHIFNHSSSHG